MSLIPNKSDYRVKLSDFYDELINQIDVFVETTIQSNKSSFIESLLTKQRDDVVAALNKDRSKSLLRLDQLYDSVEKEAQEKEDIFLISDKELHNNTTLLVILDPRFLQFGIIKLVDKWLNKQQVDLFKKLFLTDGPDGNHETDACDYMNTFWANYKYAFGSIMMIDIKDFNQLLHTKVFESSEIVEVSTSELFKISQLKFDKPIKNNGVSVTVRPEAAFLFEHAESINMWIYNEKMDDASIISDILTPFNFNQPPKTEFTFLLWGTEANLKDSHFFELFYGQNINRLTLNCSTSLITSRFFYGLNRLISLEFSNDSNLFRFDPEIFQYLTSLKTLTLTSMEVDLSGNIFVANSVLEELSFDLCRILNNKINPNIFESIENLVKLRFLRSIDRDETNYTSIFSPIVHRNVKRLEIMNYGLHKVDETMFAGMPNLTQLCLCSGGIKTISGFHSSSSLEEISLNGNYELSDLTSLASVTKLSKLCLVNVGSGNVSFLSTMDLVSLKQLTLQKNRHLSESSVDLSKMINLELLELDNCNLRIIPIKGSIPSLKRLSLANNLLTEMKPELFQHLSVPNLIYLDVSRNRFESVMADSFVTMPKLEVLVLEPLKLDIFGPVHEWPAETEPVLNGLNSLKEVREWASFNSTKYKVFVRTLNKYVWVF